MDTPSKPQDYPFDEIAEAIRKHADKGAMCYQKWTCDHCGSRQTMDEANILYTHGICEECKQTTDITVRGCNYLLHIIVPKDKVA